MDKQISVNDVFLQITDAANMMRGELVRLSNENAALKKALSEKKNEPTT